jgi:hypothetical protein
VLQALRGTREEAATESRRVQDAVFELNDTFMGIRDQLVENGETLRSILEAVSKGEQ